MKVVRINKKATDPLESIYVIALSSLLPASFFVNGIVWKFNPDLQHLSAFLFAVAIGGTFHSALLLTVSIQKAFIPLYIAYCLIFLYSLYCLVGVIILLNVLAVFSNYIIAVLALLSAFTIGFNNFFRFIQAKEFEIPFRITYSNITDFIDVFAVIAILLCCGVVFPFIFVEIDVDPMQTLTGIAISIMISTVVACRLIPKDNDTRWFCYFLKVTTIVLAVMAVAYYFKIVLGLDILLEKLPLAWVNTTLFLFTFAYAIILSCLALFYGICKIKGEGTLFKFRQVVMTTEPELDGKNKLYLIAMRYNSTEWILLPCEIRLRIIGLTGRGERQYLEEVVYCEKGKFIIKNLEGLTINKKPCGGVFPMEEEVISLLKD